MAKEVHNLDSVTLDIFDGCDDDYQPTTEELLQLWEEACKENGLNFSEKEQPSRLDLMDLWEQAVSQYKIRTVMAMADRKAVIDAGASNQDTTAEELKAAFNQSFEDLNGKDFGTACADVKQAYNDEESTSKVGARAAVLSDCGTGHREDKDGPIRMRDIIARLLMRVE